MKKFKIGHGCGKVSLSSSIALAIHRFFFARCSSKLSGNEHKNLGNCRTNLVSRIFPPHLRARKKEEGKI